MAVNAPRDPGLVPGFELGAAIGKGGFATVYRARQVSLDREVAVKIDNRVLDDERNRRRFMREVSASAMISSHPHVVSLIDAGTTKDNRPYLVMELCDNGSVGQLVKRNGPMPAPDVLELGICLSGALAAAHEKGILHRDIKPSNILIDPYGIPRLGDFGLAALSRAGEEVSVTLEALTPAYAAPEAFEQAEPSKRADVWALGATLYAVLTGIAPRHKDDGSAQTVAEIIQSLYQPLPPAQVFGADPLMSLIRRATAPQREQRFADGGEFHAALLELRGTLGRPHNVLAGGEVTRMTAAALQQARFAGPSFPSPSSAGQRLGPPPAPHGITGPTPVQPLGAAGGSRPRLRALPDPKTRPRRAWPVVVSSLVLAVAIVGAGYFIGQQRSGEAANQPPASVPTATASTAEKATPSAPTTEDAAGSGAVCFGEIVDGVDGRTAERVDCSEEHVWESFATGTFPDDADDSVLTSPKSEEAFEQTCTPGALSEYTDEPSTFFEVDALPPTKAHFDTGSRLFHCLASKGTTTGSVKKR